MAWGYRSQTSTDGCRFEFKMPHRKPAGDIAVRSPRKSESTFDVVDSPPCPNRLFSFRRRGHVAECRRQRLLRTKCENNLLVIVVPRIAQTAMGDPLTDDFAAFVET